MTLSRLIAAALTCAATATPASADITLQMKGRGQMLGTVAEGATEYRKGMKLRTDSTSNGVSMSTIIDLSKGRMIMLWHHSKTADVFEPKQISELFWKGNVPPVQPSITPTTQSRQIAGWTCIVHNVTGSYSVAKLDMVPPTMVTQGTMCLVKNGPGQADYTAFYQAAGKGAPFDPSLGVPFATEMTIGFKGDEPTSGVMEAGTYTIEVISVSTAPIPDSMFEIPADYTVTKR
jgi:hypothetical protein